MIRGARNLAARVSSVARAGRKPRAAATAVALVALGAVAGSPLSAEAVETFKDVVVRNTAENPVPTRAIGETAVRGTVGLAEGARVEVGNPVSVASSAENPVMVKVVRNAERRQWMRFSDFHGLESEQLGRAGRPLYTVPDGKAFVVTSLTGSADAALISVALFSSCPGDSGTQFHGIIGELGELIHGGRDWRWTGEAGFPAGCVLRPYAHRARETEGQGAAGMTVHLNGYVVDE